MQRIAAVWNLGTCSGVQYEHVNRLQGRAGQDRSGQDKAAYSEWSKQSRAEQGNSTPPRLDGKKYRRTALVDGRVKVWQRSPAVRRGAVRPCVVSLQRMAGLLSTYTSRHTIFSYCSIDSVSVLSVYSLVVPMQLPILCHGYWPP